MLKLRWKLLILLLVVAVLPIFVVRVVDALSTRELGHELASHASDALAAAAEQQLSQLIRNYTEALDREERLLKLMLSIQVEAVEDRLAGPVPTDHPKIWFNTDFDAPKSSVPGLASSAFHGVVLPNGEHREQLISMATQVFRLSPGVERATVEDDLKRLANLTDAYRRIHAFFPDAVLWQYTTLDSGLHSSYPGKGGYPPDYEPRKRPWYHQASTSNAVSWMPPTADLTTGRATLTLAAPVHGDGGEVRGVTAMDIPVTSVLGRPRMSATWAPQSRRYLITIEQTAFVREIGMEVKTGRIGPVPLIFAESRADEERSDWRKAAQLRVLEADDEAVIDQFVERIGGGGSGVMSATVGGVEQLWAWGVIGDAGNVALLVTVPRTAILAEAERLETDSLNAVWRSLQSSAVVVIIVLALVFLVVWRGSREVSQPILQLSEAAAAVAEGEFDTRVTLRQRIPDELTEMAESFNDMVPQLQERMQMRQSLNLAMEVQQSLLPTSTPKLEGVDVSGHSVYCDETGGDYYDFLEFEQLGSKQLGVVIGDVVGHGIAAALLMATTRALLRSRVVLPGSLEQVFGDVNAHLCAGGFTGRFMTMFYLVIDTESRQLRWLSAGHDPAIVYDPTDHAFHELEGRDVPLGLDPDWRYTEVSQSGWQAGQIIVIGTDGIWEARDRTGEMFGKDRLRDVIRQNANQPTAIITRAIHDAVRTFRGSMEQQDDITLVVIKMLE